MVERSVWMVVGAVLAMAFAVDSASAQEPPAAEAAPAATDASADEAPPAAEAAPPEVPVADDAPPKTVPADLGFGQQELSRRYYFPDASRYSARADRRDAIDASSDRTIVWPTAHTPHKHTLALSNTMGVLTQLSYSPTDDWELTGSVVLPFDAADTHIALSSKFSLSESENYVFSLQPFGQFRRGRQVLANGDFGLGLAALVDLVLTNDLIVTLGAVGYGTLVAITGEYSYDNCQSRSDYIDGTCSETTTTSKAFPAGGHFLGGQVGMTWYIFDSFSLKAEFMTGVAAGSVLGSEWLTRTVNPVEEGERFANGPAAAGLPYDTDATLGAGLQWSNGLFAVQFSGYILRAPLWYDPTSGARDFYLVPMVNAGMAVF